MKRFWRLTSIVVLAIVCSSQLSVAQYYSWGADRASLKWSKIDGDRVNILYPDSVELTARRTLHYIDAVGEDIYYDFQHQPLKVPFVIHPENFVSNGMVMWAPLRVEFLSTPDINNYSMPWIKHLVAHEYRHAVQYNNLDRSTLKVFSYILGQQGAAASLLFPPLYALEGDAVLCETQMSTFGRGLQPSFSMGYRALADEIMDEKDYLKWRCGSYLTAIPDHYAMGYQMLSYAYSKYNENILDKSFEYISRNPQFISPYSIALRKYYNTSTKELFYESFNSLINLWDSLPKVKQTSKVISCVDTTNYTTFSHPIELEDGTLLTLKSDYKEPSRFIIFDPATSSERVIAHTGYLSTRPQYATGRVWWTEYRRSLLFTEDVNSQLCYMDIEEGKPKSIKGYTNALYPTPIEYSKDHIAYVEYNPSGQYSVVEIDDGKEITRKEITYPNEVHSMAWDNKTKKLYIIVTGDKGMWIEEERQNGFEPITQPAYITISNLTAHEGVLYFGSIASGRDELHSLDILSGKELQLTQSSYGSFQASRGEERLYMTTYNKYGYHLAEQGGEQVVKEVEYSSTPTNLVNPTPVEWDVVNLDTVSFDKLALNRSKQKYKSQRYRKGSHLINIHSWAPMRYDPFNILNEQNLDIGLGATIVSQNLLSSCEGYLSYGWDRTQGSILRTGILYDGLGVNLNLAATYGGKQNIYLLSSADSPLGKYYNVSLSASLPMYFNRGYHTRVITPYSAWSYSNGIVPHGDLYLWVNPETITMSSELHYNELKEGLNKFSIGVSYTDYVQAAVRDINIPKGYTLSAGFAADPFNSDFSKLISLYGKLYTPGFAQNNSLTLAVAYQNSIGGFEYNGYNPLSYLSSALIPTGFTSYDISNNNYMAASAKYQFPLCYPELGAIWDLLYIKRLSMGFGVDYAHFDSIGFDDTSIHSYGVDLMIDINILSMTAASTSKLSLSFYRPKGKSFYFQFGLGLPIN
ncbi:MAG: hypothetical protein R3Y08_04125 [Rikenellaceae bacterium]